MIEIIILIFLCWQIGNKAKQKGLKRSTWWLYTVAAWFSAEIFIGFPLAFSVMKMNVAQLQNIAAKAHAMADLSSLFLFELIAVMCGFGGYLLVRYNLEKKPDYHDNETRRDVGIDDLKPPTK